MKNSKAHPLLVNFNWSNKTLLSFSRQKSAFILYLACYPRRRRKIAFSNIGSSTKLTLANLEKVQQSQAWLLLGKQTTRKSQAYRLENIKKRGGGKLFLDCYQEKKPVPSGRDVLFYFNCIAWLFILYSTQSYSRVERSKANKYSPQELTLTQGKAFV